MVDESHEGVEKYQVDGQEDLHAGDVRVQVDPRLCAVKYLQKRGFWRFFDVLRVLEDDLLCVNDGVVVAFVFLLVLEVHFPQVQL